MGRPPKKKNKIDISTLLKQVQASYGKDKGRAGEVSTGSSLVRPNRDEQFVCWKDSPWEALTQIRGLPFGRICQIAGKPDSGKSTHAMQFMKNAQDQDYVVILWDAENKFSATRFDKYFGGCSDDLLLVRSKMILEGGDRIERFIHETKKMDPDAKILVVWDSVGGTLAKNEGVEVTEKDGKDNKYEGSMSDSKQLASAAKENGTILRGFIRLMEKYKDKKTNDEAISILLINQTYSNIGSHGQKESGGQKVEFFSSIIVQLTRKGDLTFMRDKIKRKKGIVSRAKVSKNHLFDGEDTIAELELAITAGGINLLSDYKILDKNSKSGWESNDDADVEVEAPQPNESN